MNYIQGYCRIKKGTVTVNGQKIFSSSGLFGELMDELYSSLNLTYPKFYKMDHLSKLGFLATETLLREGKTSFDPYTVSIVLSNSNSSLETDKNYFESAKKVASPALFVYTLPNIVNGEIAIRHGFKGESTFFVTPRFDPDLLCAYCDELLKEKSKLCIAGWVEVMGEDYEGFLYLVGKEQRGLNKSHTPEISRDLYSA